jgi:uncharacterized Zn-binding protein involved in type VI secretion
VPSVAVNPPKTPVTKASSGVAAATIPNVCKMPGPPAPFVPTPLPNIGQSGKAPEGYSTSVKIEGATVAIRGSSFGSSGDIASKGTGGGIISCNTEGPTKFIAPGALTVQIEGCNVQLLGDQMLNNCGPGGSPANAATLMGLAQPPNVVPPAPPSQECQEAADDINGVIKGQGGQKPITKREAELKANPRNQPMFWADANPGLPRPKGSDQWGHLIAIEQQQNALQRGLQKYYANNCDNVDDATMQQASDYVMADPMDML